MAASKEKAACFANLPVEILLEICQQLDASSIFELSATNQYFLGFYEHRKAAILLPALLRDFSPFEELLQVYTASEDDISINSGLYNPRKIVFKRYAGDAGLVLAQGALPRSMANDNSCSEFMPVGQGRRTAISGAHNKHTRILTDRDLGPLLQMCRLVRRWESLFPQMRWFHQPELCRFLRPHEQLRFRRALYRWWLYGIYFHGDFLRPRVGHPEPLVNDIRTSQMRYHCTGELLELMDFLETIKDVILQYICPRLELDEEEPSCFSSTNGVTSRSLSLATSWNDQTLWGRIIKTYAKLGPGELLHYFGNICSYPANRLVGEIRLRHPNFTFDQESIGIAVRCALDERGWLDKAPSLAEDAGGGIVDFDDERDGERETLRSDASSDGSLPAGSRFVQTFSRYSPRGDDGSFVGSPQRPIDSRPLASAAAV
ncbi:hypothetical protein HIM_01620 [Hirsutella minnesotensis 3608]|nr:hypothetical protein HIM_01620 [Hirsutella minnesotensis 3608]